MNKNDKKDDLYLNLSPKIINHGYLQKSLSWMTVLVAWVCLTSHKVIDFVIYTFEMIDKILNNWVYEVLNLLEGQMTIRPIVWFNACQQKSYICLWFLILPTRMVVAWINMLITWASCVVFRSKFKVSKLGLRSFIWKCSEHWCSIFVWPINKGHLASLKIRS